MKKYNINIYSNKIAILCLIILFPLTLYIVNYITLGINFTLQILIFFVLMIGAGYLTTVLSRAKIRIELTEESFKHIWVKKFFFSRDKDIELNWSQILNYVFESDRGFDSFQLTLPEKKRYKVFRYNHFSQKDDFHNFEIQFPKFINKINATKDNKSIEKGRTIYEEPIFKLIMIFTTFVVLFLISYNILNPENNTNWSALGVSVAATGFYWMQIIRYRKR